MEELILQVHVLPPQEITEKYDCVKNEIIEYPSSEFDISPQQNVQTITDIVRTVNDHAVSVSIDEQSEEKSQKNPPRKRKEVVFAPPPYDIVPPRRPKHKSHSFDDLPPPYDPSLRRSMVSIISLEDEILNFERNLNERSSFFGILMEAGFNYCSIEQIIVTIAIIGTFIFLGLSYCS